jgi:glycosyltransferase domain-containing protein
MKCTVVIPTYNRPPHLKRILSYYCQYGKDLAIVVADSSLAENKKKNAQIISTFEDVPILHLGQYDERIDPWHKILDSLKHVGTEYCLLCADDDFVTSKGIHEAVDFLDKNPDYIMAYGNNIWFSFKYNIRGKLEFTYKYYESLVKTQFEAKDRLLSKATDNSQVTTYYAVQRTHLMKDIFEEAAKITPGLQSAGALRQTADLLFAELLVFWLPPVYGKMKCLDTLYYAREDCTPQSVSRVYVTLPDLMNDQNYNVKMQEFIDTMSGHLDKQSGIGLSEAHRIVEKALQIYIRRAPSFVLMVNSMLGKLHLPACLDLAIRKVYRAASSVIYPPTGSGHTFPRKYNYELDKVRLSVLSSAEEVYGTGSE